MARSFLVINLFRVFYLFPTNFYFRNKIKKKEELLYINNKIIYVNLNQLFLLKFYYFYRFSPVAPFSRLGFIKNAVKFSIYGNLYRGFPKEHIILISITTETLVT